MRKNNNFMNLAEGRVRERSMQWKAEEAKKEEGLQFERRKDVEEEEKE